MADFQSGVNPIDPANVGGGVRPVDTSTASAIQSAGNILGGLGQTAMNAYGAAQAQKTSDAQSKFLGGLSQQYLRVADLQQQGTLSADQAYRRMRLITSQAIANSPHLQDAIVKTYGNIIDKAGLGLNVAQAYNREQDDADQQRQAAVMAAQKDGFVNPSMTPAQQAAAVNQHQQYVFAQNQMANAKAQMDMNKQELDMQLTRTSIANNNLQYQRNAWQFKQDRAKANFYEGAKNVSAAYFDKFHTSLDAGLAAVKAGQLKPDDFINQIHTQLAVMSQNASQLGTQSGQTEQLMALLKPAQDLAQAYIDNASGKTTNDVLQLAIGNTMANNTQNVLASDPSFGRLASISKMIPSTLTSLQQPLGDMAIATLKRNGVMDDSGNVLDPAQRNKPADITNNNDPSHNLGIDQYAGMVASAAKLSRATNADPKLVAETSGHIEQMLKGFGMYASTTQSPTDLKSAIKFFSNPDVGAYLKEHPDIVRGDAAEGAVSAYQHSFEDIVMPVVQNELTHHKVAVTDRFNNTQMEAATNKISMTFNGANVSFVAKDNSPDVRQTATRLNKELAPIVTNLVRMRAHLSGSTDYKRYYSELEPALLGSSEGGDNENSAN